MSYPYFADEDSLFRLTCQFLDAVRPKVGENYGEASLRTSTHTMLRKGYGQRHFYASIHEAIAAQCTWKYGEELDPGELAQLISMEQQRFDVYAIRAGRSYVPDPTWYLDNNVEKYQFHRPWAPCPTTEALIAALSVRFPEPEGVYGVVYWTQQLACPANHTALETIVGKVLVRMLPRGWDEAAAEWLEEFRITYHARWGV